MAFSYDGFSAVAKENINPIKFAEKSELLRIQDFLLEKLELTKIATDTPASSISDICSQLEGIMNNPDNVGVTSLLDKIANDLSGAISSSYNILKTTLYEEVSALGATMLSRYNEELRNVGAEVLISDSSKPSVDFNMLDWDQLKSPAYVAEVLTTIANLGIKDPVPNNNNSLYAINKLPLGGFTPIEFSPEVLTTITDGLSGILVSIDAIRVKDAFNIFIDRRRYIAYSKTLSSPSAEVASVLAETKLVKQVIKALEYLNMDISVETKGYLFENLKALRYTTHIIEFLLLTKKASTAGYLVVSRDLLNEEELKRFYVAGGTLEDIAYHLRMFYDKKALPLLGISTDTILEFKDKVDELVKAKNLEIKSMMRIIKHRASLAAIHETLNTYLKDVAEDIIPNKLSKMDFYRAYYPVITRIVDNFNTDKDNFEDVCYSFLINVWHKGSLVETLHSYLGMQFIKLAEEDKLGDAEQVAIADTISISTILAEYFHKHHTI